MLLAVRGGDVGAVTDCKHCRRVIGVVTLPPDCSIDYYYYWGHRGRRKLPRGLFLAGGRKEQRHVPISAQPPPPPNPSFVTMTHVQGGGGGGDCNLQHPS